MSPPREKWAVGNWKLNGNRAQNAVLLRALLDGVGQVRPGTVGVCVPFPYLWQAQQVLTGSPIFWGAQDVSNHESGAFTGQVSAGMLNEFGCSICLVGHSERRRWNCESNDLVGAKAVRALANGLRPLVCVGETLEEHEAGEAHAVVTGQLLAVMEQIEPGDLARIALAYEPVWAIGTGRTASPEYAQEVHAMLRGVMARRSGPAAQGMTILYGGSVKADNAAELFAMPDIDGALVGGASLQAKDFLGIVAALGAKALDG